MKSQPKYPGVKKLRLKMGQVTVMFCSLVIIIKNSNSINSKRPWPPIFDLASFSAWPFLDSWPQLFSPGCFDWDTTICKSYTIWIIQCTIPVAIAASVHAISISVTCYHRYKCRYSWLLEYVIANDAYAQCSLKFINE